MSFQKMIDDLKQHIDGRFDELEAKLAVRVVHSPEPLPAPVETLGLPSNQEAALIAAGYLTVEDLAAASDDELAAVDGVGKRTIEFIRGRVG